MKKKLTFFTFGEDVFLRDLIVELRKDYNIKFFQRGEEKEFQTMLHDTDIAWFEWCDNLPVFATKSPKMCKYVCRLHSYEMFTNFPGQVDWNKIDKLIFVGEPVKDYCLKKFNIRQDIATVINNGIDINKFVIPKVKKHNKKIAYVGFLNYKKGPQLLLQTFKAIYDYDPEFEFHIAGDFQDERYFLYFQTIMPHMPFKIHMDGWVKDMPSYLEDKGYVISTSLFESFQYSIAEGMAQGICPLVHGWLGSNLYYPKENIFFSPNECVNIIDKFEKEKDKDKMRMEWRNHIKKNFSLDRQISEIKKVLEDL